MSTSSHQNGDSGGITRAGDGHRDRDGRVQNPWLAAVMSNPALAERRLASLRSQAAKAAMAGKADEAARLAGEADRFVESRVEHAREDRVRRIDAALARIDAQLETARRGLDEMRKRSDRGSAEHQTEVNPPPSGRSEPEHDRWPARDNGREAGR